MKSFVETQDGKVAIIICAVDSNPLSELALRRADELVASGSSRGDGASGQRLRISATPNSLKLEIRSVTLEDEGTYVCSANSAIGKANTSIYFSIESEYGVHQLKCHLEGNSGQVLSPTALPPHQGMESSCLLCWGFSWPGQCQLSRQRNVRAGSYATPSYPSIGGVLRQGGGYG